MPRPVWDGDIAFGLINIPVQLLPAERPNELSFHLLDKADHHRIRNERVNEATGKVVPWNRIVKGYEIEKDHYVILEEDDFAAASVHGSHTLDLLGFIDIDSIDPIYFKKPYYLMPGKSGSKGYSLLLETLKQAGKGGLAKFVLKTREYLALIVPWHGTLTLMLLRFEEDILPKSEASAPAKKAGRKAAHSDRKATVSDREVAMAKHLVDAMSIDWKPAAYHDEYKEKLLAWIHTKASGHKTPKTPATRHAVGKSNVVSMLDLLKRSVDHVPPGKAGQPKKRSARRSATTTGRHRRRAAHGTGR